ncbi:hypothetical protein CALCODRAFT_485266 [Calocera cornea HHB12733]|uniref:Uncharacterized protein n=1 Tax=Calocera cornea HHB12733 TaxID=1353952 RepID=A0A165EFX1_9BASI|nr:hypothetical protein CALCODRAFT_485266 [Calocera cornea HHB12733]
MSTQPTQPMRAPRMSDWVAKQCTTRGGNAYTQYEMKHLSGLYIRGQGWEALLNHTFVHLSPPADMGGIDDLSYWASDGHHIVWVKKSVDGGVQWVKTGPEDRDGDNPPRHSIEHELTLHFDSVRGYRWEVPPKSMAELMAEDEERRREEAEERRAKRRKTAPKKDKAEGATKGKGKAASAGKGKGKGKGKAGKVEGA